MEIIFLGITLANTFKITHQLIPLLGIFQCLHPPSYSMGLWPGGITFIRIIHIRIEIAVFQLFIKQRSFLLCEVAPYALSPIFQVFFHQGECLFVSEKRAKGKGFVISGIVNKRLNPHRAIPAFLQVVLAHIQDVVPFGNRLFVFVQRPKHAGTRINNVGVGWFNFLCPIRILQCLFVFAIIPQIICHPGEQIAVFWCLLHHLAQQITCCPIFLLPY